MDNFTLIPHSNILPQIFNGKGFTFSIITTLNKGRGRRATSHCPLFLIRNPRRAFDLGFSIGHGDSSQGLEVRIADGYEMSILKFSHKMVNPGETHNRTLRVWRGYKNKTDEFPGIMIEMWLNGTSLGRLNATNVRGDIYRGKSGVTFGDVWGWQFEGVINSFSLSAIDPLDILSPENRSKVLLKQKLEIMDGDEEYSANDDDLGDELIEVEEFEFSSPQDVQNSWKSSIEEVSRISKENERDGVENNLPDSCRWGFQSCMHDKHGPLFKRAKEEAAIRKTVRDPEKHKKLMSALMPSLAAPDVDIGMLPYPLENGTASSENASSSDNKAISSIKEAYLTSVTVATEVMKGSIVRTGAISSNLTELAEKAEESRTRHHKRRYGRDRIDVAWQLATEMGEKNTMKNFSKGKIQTFPSHIDTELLEWFKEGGGELRYSEVQAEGHYKNKRILVAEEDLSEGDEIISVPFKLTMNRITMRNIGLNCDGKCSFLTEFFGPIFDKDDRWGLATLLLHEQAKGTESRWYPFIRTLKMQVLSRKVVKELEGTYAMELDSFRGQEAEAALDFVNKELCNKHNPKACNFGKTRKEFRWALGVVHRYAYNLTKGTSGKFYLSLIPYGHLLRHAQGTGGSCLLHLDNTVRFKVGEDHETGTVLRIDRGQLSDSETMLRYHRVSEHVNPHNEIVFRLPGAQGLRDWMFDKWRATMDEWRRQIHMPPKQSDLWRSAKELNLYGYEDDEEEESVFRYSNSKETQALLKSLPMSTDEVSAEEQLMLLGYAKDEASAEKMLTGTNKRSHQTMIYKAPDIDENPHAENAFQDLSDATVQLYESIAAGHQDPSVLKVINETREFLENGKAPKKGIDDVDRLLMRKRYLMGKCGISESHRLTEKGDVLRPPSAMNDKTTSDIDYDNEDIDDILDEDEGEIEKQKSKHLVISAALMCAVRVSVMNETDVDILCPRAKGAWDDHKCEEEIFSEYEPVDRNNEIGMLSALRESIKSLLDGFKSTLQEDRSLLELSSFGPATRSAILLRYREKVLLQRALEDLDDWESSMGTFKYQLSAIKALRDRRKKELEKKNRIREEAIKNFKNPQVVINISFYVSELHGNQTLVVLEGDSIDEKAEAFANKWNISSKVDEVKNLAKFVTKVEQPKLLLWLPIILPTAKPGVLYIREGDDSVFAVQVFIAVHNLSLTDHQEKSLTHYVSEVLRIRKLRRVIFSKRITAPDGRTLVLQIHDGDQHNFIASLRHWATAVRLKMSAVPQLVNALQPLLGPTLLNLPVDFPGKRKLNLRILKGDTLYDTVRIFCDVNQIPQSHVEAIANSAKQRLGL